MSLVPAENRGYRELYVYARQLAEHWGALAEQLPGSPTTQLLARGVSAARELIDELAPLTAAQGLHGGPAAQGLGASMGRQRGKVRDRFLERNQAVRFAVEDLQHVVTLLGYLESVSTASANGELAELAGRWQRKLRRLETDVRRAAAELGTDPHAAIEPLDPSPLGRAAHSVGYAAGTVGEWVDRRAGRG